MNGFDQAEHDYLYPPDRIVRCQLCDAAIDMEDADDPECEYCNECYKELRELEIEEDEI